MLIYGTNIQRLSYKNYNYAALIIRIRTICSTEVLFIFNRFCIKTGNGCIDFFSNNPLNIVKFSMTTIYPWISVAVILSHFGVFNTPLKRFLYCDTDKFCI